jgi:hypothetical protein
MTKKLQRKSYNEAFRREAVRLAYGSQSVHKAEPRSDLVCD